MPNMIGIERLDQCLQIIGATSVVQNGMGPISAALIAPSDAGKSRLMLKNLPRDARVVNDLTTMTLQKIISEKHPPPYLAIPDFNTVISHKPTVAELTMAMLLSLMAEGVTELNPGLQNHIVTERKGESAGIRIAVVTGMTPEMFWSKRGKWRATGFLRRLVPINYAYSRLTRERIQASITAEGGDVLSYLHKPAAPKLRRCHVEIPRHFNDDLRLLSEQVIEQLAWKQERKNGTQAMVKANEYPFSMHKTLRQLARASAALDHRRTVNGDDIEKVRDMSKFMRYDRPEEV